MDDTRLIEVLERSRDLGFLGPGSVRVHVDHAAGFAAGIARAPVQFLDLGSGGGVPGLVLARTWPESRVVLLDARERRCGFLREAVRDLDLAEHVVVVWALAEEAGATAWAAGRAMTLEQAVAYAQTEDEAGGQAEPDRSRDAE